MAAKPPFTGKLIARLTSRFPAGLQASALPLRFFILVAIFVTLAGTTSASIAAGSKPKLPADTPVTVVSETYNEWTLNSGLLYWGEGACSGEITYNGYLRRLPVNGGNPITLGTVTPSTCSTYFALAANSNGVFYFDASVGPQIEFRASGNPTIAKSVFKLTVAQEPYFTEDRLGLDGNYIYWYTASQLLRVREDGTDFGTVVASLSGATDLYVIGGTVYWLDSTGLWETSVNCSSLPCTTLQLSTVTGNNLFYYFHSGGPIVQHSTNFLYASGTSIHHVTCPIYIAFCSDSTFYTAPSDGNPWTIGRPTSDGTNLFWEEGWFNIPGNATGRLRRMPLTGGTAVDIATNLYMVPGTVYIDTNNIYFPSVDNSTTDILKLPLNASALVRDLSADAIEVTQGIQNLANDVPLVEGKPTFVRGYGLESSGPSAAAVEAYLYGFSNNSPLPGSPLHSINGEVSITTGVTYVRANLNSGWLFQLPDSWTQAGAITLRLSVDPLQIYADPNLTNNTLDSTVSFSTRQPACLIFKTVQTDAPVPSIDPVYFPQMIDFAQRMWPTPSFLSYDGGGPMNKLTVCTWGILPYPCYRPFHLPDDTWELFTGMGLEYLTSDLVSQCSPLVINSSVHYVGLVDAATNTDTNSGTVLGQGMIDVLPLTWVKLSTDLVGPNDPFGPQDGETLGHEAAHNLGRLHVDCGGPADVDPNYPYPTNQLDFAGNANHYGFDVKSLTVIPPTSAKDLMSYCEPKWVSDYTWKGLFNGLSPLLPAPSSGTPASPELANAASNILITGAVTPTLNTGNLGYAWNFPTAALSNQTLQRWQQYSDQTAAILAASAPLTVTYHVQLLGPTGTVLADRAVNPEAPHIHTGSTPTSFFVATFPAPSSQVAKIQFMGNSTVLASRSPGLSAPTVSVIKPAGGETIGDSIDLSWQAQDADPGDVLHYMVQYSPDNGKTWSTQVTDLSNLPGATTTNLTLDLSGMPGSLPNQALIRVIASDGYNTGIAVSNTFTVSPRKPKPYIMTPGPIDTTPAGGSAILRGGAMDAIDGAISGTGLSWTVDGNAAGSGLEASVPGLAPGDHPVVLTARNSLSQTNTAQAILTILPLSIPNSTSPTLDGYCDDPAYANSTQVQLKPYGSGDQANVHILRDNSAIWACFTGLKFGVTTPGAFAGLQIDVNYTRDILAGPNDYGFFVGEDGGVSSLAGDGAGDFTGTGPAGLTARISASKFTWSAELRIDASAIGGFDHIIGMSLGHFSVSSSGDNYAWPFNSIFSQPRTWATTALAPVPSINHFTPGNTTVGNPGFTLVISGTNFVNNSQVLWSGTPLSTTFGTSSVISTTLNAAQLSTAGSFPVTVRNPGNITSGAVPFSVNNPIPAINSLTPGTIQAESATFALHVDGNSFINGAKIAWNGQQLNTTFIDAGHLTAPVDASLLLYGGMVSITVINPGPGGGASSEAPFVITPRFDQFLPVMRKP